MVYRKALTLSTLRVAGRPNVCGKFAGFSPAPTYTVGQSLQRAFF
jgi:hypothetical protein